MFFFCQSKSTSKVKEISASVVSVAAVSTIKNRDALYTIVVSKFSKRRWTIFIILSLIRYKFGGSIFWYHTLNIVLRSQSKGHNLEYTL